MQAVRGVALVVGVRVEPPQLVGDLERLQELPAGVPVGEGELNACPGPDGVGVQAAAQVPAGPVARVAGVPAPPELLLLPASADLIQRGLRELDDMEGV